MKLLLYVIVLFYMTTSVFFSSENKTRDKIGIMKFEVTDNVNSTLGNFLYDILLSEMLSSDQITLVDWTQIDRVSKLLSKSNPDISDELALRNAVKQLGIKKLYVGSLTKVGSRFHLF